MDLAWPPHNSEILDRFAFFHTLESSVVMLIGASKISSTLHSIDVHSLELPFILFKRCTCINRTLTLEVIISNDLSLCGILKGYNFSHKKYRK